MKRLIKVSSNERISNIIVNALTIYAELAFPGEVSPCNIPAKAALLDAAESFRESFESSGYGVINSRQRVIVSEAVKAYFELLRQQENRSFENQCQFVLAVCKGEYEMSDDLDEELNTAIKKDAG